ncbi:flavin monoamine oxidase family protein [Pyruvatibacter sp.]|uniref:flavin monoamine oxidase family protein n=1 Tax=Pyruvatibacter sp. TaxID=1981328 RepID=UPI0032668D5B
MSEQAGSIDRRVDVAVVGAGMAGLKTALELEARGLTVCLLEARDRVGGRLKPGHIAGHKIDNGGQWVGPQQKLLLAEAEAQGVEKFDQYRQGKSVLDFKGKLSHSRSDVPKMPFVSLLDLQRTVSKLDALAFSLPATAPWSVKNAVGLDGQTFETWIQANVWTEQTREFLRMVTRSLLCCEPKHVSFLYFLEYVRGGEGLDVLLGVKGGAQEAKFRGGAHQITEKMAARLKSPVVYEAPARAVTQHDTHVEILTDRGTVTADRAVIAIPPTLASRINFANSLPVMRDHLMQRMPMGTVIKVHVAYDKPFWRDKGLSGMGASDLLPCNVFFDQSPEDASCGILVGFIDADAAAEHSIAGDNSRRQAVIDSAVQFFGAEAKNPIDYVDNDWMSEEWSKGCYVAHMAPGVMTTFGEALREPCGRIHWAGTETATQWQGYMDGALQSGIRVAAEIAEQRGLRMAAE